MLCSENLSSIRIDLASAKALGTRSGGLPDTCRPALPLLAGVLLAGVATSAQAQAERPVAPPRPVQPQQPDESHRPADATRFGLTVEPSLTMVYDDNVYRVDSDVTDPVHDVIVTPAIEARFSRDVGPRALNLRALAGYDRFISEVGRSKPRLELEGSGRLLLGGQCSFRPGASYRQLRADYGDINSASENLQRFSTLGVTADCERPAGFYPIAAYRRGTTRNGEGFEYADQTSDLYRAGIGYSLPSLGKVTGYYEHVSSRRPELNVTNRSQAVGVSFERSVSPLTSIAADLRWTRVTSTSNAVGTYNGPSWTLRLATTVIPRVRLTASTERTIVNDSLIATGFAVRTAHRLSADVGLSELTSIGAFGELVRRDFRQDAAIRSFAYTHDRTSQFGVVARRKLTDRFSIEASASRFSRSTNSDVSNFRATRFAVGATMGF